MFGSKTYNNLCLHVKRRYILMIQNVSTSQNLFYKGRCKLRFHRWGFNGVYWKCPENGHFHGGNIYWHTGQRSIWRCPFPVWKHPFLEWTDEHGRILGMLHTWSLTDLFFRANQHLMFPFIKEQQFFYSQNRSKFSSISLQRMSNVELTLISQNDS